MAVDHVTIGTPGPPTEFAVTTAEDEFDFTFGYFQATDILVYVDDELQSSSLYTLVGNAVGGGFQGGTVTFTTAVSNVTVRIDRQVTRARDTDFDPSVRFDVRQLNTEFDIIHALEQENANTHNRSIRFPTVDFDIDAELPRAADRAGRILAFDDDGNLIFHEKVDVGETTSELVTYSGAASPAGPGSTTVDVALRTLFARWQFDDLTALTGSSLGYADATSGQYVHTRKEGYVYEVKPAGTALSPTGYHVATSGGLLLAVVPQKDEVEAQAFGGTWDGAANDGPIINRAIAALGAARQGGTVWLPAVGTIGTAETISVGDGSPGVASSYHNLVLKGRGPAPGSSPNSATILKWIGASAPTGAIIEINGLSIGLGVSGIFPDGDGLVGDALRIRSNQFGEYGLIYASGYTRYGLFLTSNEAPIANSWHTSRNQFKLMLFASSEPNTQALRLDGFDDGSINTGVWGNTFESVAGDAPRSLDPAHLPCALYLGYCDSNSFTKCDLTLTVGSFLPPDRFSTNLDALAALNGTGRADGEITRVVQGLDPLGSSTPAIRWSILFQFVAGSSETADDVNIIEPADSVGRFFKVQGAGIVIDGTKRDNFPADNMFTNCALARYVPMVDITTGGNTPGREEDAVPSLYFVAYPGFDRADKPVHITHVHGFSDGDVHFGGQPFDVRGDSLERKISHTQSNNLRQVMIKLNASSTTGTGAGGHNGTRFEHRERSADTDPWTTTGRINLTREGDWDPNADTQDLGNTNNWRRVNANSFSSFLVTIADDDFATITPERDEGVVSITRLGAPSQTTMSAYKVSASEAFTIMSSGGSPNIVATTGALNGTTGTDGQITLSASGGDIYIENRNGTSVSFRGTFL